MQAKEILEKAADLLEKKDWTTRTMARNSLGEPVRNLNDADAYCVVGACLKVTNTETNITGHPFYPLPKPLGEALALLYQQLNPHFAVTVKDRFLIGRLTTYNDAFKNKESAIRFLRRSAQSAKN